MTRLLLLACVVGLAHGTVQDDRDRAIRLATDALARHLEVAPEKIQLVSAEPVDWSNSSLGCPKEGMSYLQVIVPGFRVRLAVGDRQHEVHTGKGHAVVCDEATSGVKPVTPSLAAADRAKQALAAQLKVKPEALTVGSVRPWRSTDRACDPPNGANIEGETFFVELTRGSMTYRYRATPQAAWACP